MTKEPLIAMEPSPFSSEATTNPRRGGGDLTWGGQDRSDSSWANLKAFAGLTEDGQVVAWGDPASGGNLDDTSRARLTRQAGSETDGWIWTVELASSSRAFAARRANGEVVAWGDPASGGSIPEKLRDALASGVVRVFGLAQGFAALKSDGTLITWGAGSSSSIQATDLDPSQPFRVVTSFDSLAILQGERLVGCWGGNAGASQWRQSGPLRDALAAGVKELECNDAGFAARTARGQVITWGVPQGIGDASGVSISNHPDIVRLGSDVYEFHGFDAQSRIFLWGGREISGQMQYASGLGPVRWPYPPDNPPPIEGARREFSVPGGGIGWSFNDNSLVLYGIGGGVYQGSSSSEDPILGSSGLAVITPDGGLETFGYKIGLNSPNTKGFFSPLNIAKTAKWQVVRSSGGAYAALASDGTIGLWGQPDSGASPANPDLVQQLLEQHPAAALYSNNGAFVTLAADGTAISWGASGSGGDQGGAPQIFADLNHIVSPWANVRIDELGPGMLSLLANGKANPDGQAIPILVQEGDQLSVDIKNDPNGDRDDTTGNVYQWQRNGQPRSDNKQASVNLDALSTGTWSVTPTYLDLPGFAKTMAPLSVQVQMVDNGQASVSICPTNFHGPADQAFTAGNGKVSELLATIAGDPEGIRHIDAIQWFRNQTPIPSSGTPARSILQASEPGTYSFSATYTDNQGYQRTIRSGAVQIDPAGSVPTQSHLATGGLQTLWRLAEDGRSIERFDSTSLRMRPVDMADVPGYLAISASSDGRAWALDNKGYACLYDAPSNRFLPQDGSGSGADQQLNLGSGWRQIVAALGSNTDPALWLLGDAPLDGSSNVAYVPGALTQGQTLADLKPITVNGGPQLRLLAVGDDQAPWGIDQDGDIWQWNTENANFDLLAAGVGSHIRQLQVIDPTTVWGLSDQGELQMWDDAKRRFKAVPLDSPFFSRRSELLTPVQKTTWESFSLSQLGGFAGIPRSGATPPTGGSGLVCFDTSEIRMLSASSENISQLRLLNSLAIQDNGTITNGQNLAFTKNEYVGVAYVLPGSASGQWDGASLIPGAQSSKNLTIEGNSARNDNTGERLPVLKVTLNAEARESNSATARTSYGYISPFGGLVFTQAEQPQPTEAVNQEKARYAITTQPIGGTNEPQVVDLAAAASGLGKFNFKAGAGLTSGANAEFSYEYEKKLTNWKFSLAASAKASNASNLKDVSKKIDLIFGANFKWAKEASKDAWWNTGGANTLKPEWLKEKDPVFRDYRKREIDFGEEDHYYSNEDGDWEEPLVSIGGIKSVKVLSKQAGSKITFAIDLQAKSTYDFKTKETKSSETISGSFKTELPIYSWGLGIFQLSMITGVSLDYQVSHSGFTTMLPVMNLIDANTGQLATRNTPQTDILIALAPDSLTRLENHPVIKAIQENALPAVSALEDYIKPVFSILGALTSSSPLASSILSPAAKDELLGTYLTSLRSDSLDISEPVSNLLNPSFSFAFKPFVGAKLTVSSPFVEAEGSAKLNVTDKWDSAKGFSMEANLKFGIEVSALWFKWSEEFSVPIASKPSAGAAVSTIAQQNPYSPLELPINEPGAWAVTTSIERSNLNGHLTQDSRGLITPITQLIPSRSKDSLLPNQQLKPGEYILSANGQYMAQMQSDGNFVVQTLTTNGLWAVSFSLNDYRDKNGNQPIVNIDNPAVKLGSMPGTSLAFRNGKLCFTNPYFKTADGTNSIVIDGGSYLRGGRGAIGNSYPVRTAELPSGTELRELTLGNDGVLEAIATDGSRVFSFEPHYIYENRISGAIPKEKLSGYIHKNSAIGIATRLLPGNSGLFELMWVHGAVQPDGLTVAWDASSAQPIEGSAGYTTNVSLIELSDGRLGVAGSHIAADDPLLAPITQLAPGAIYGINADSQSADTTTLLHSQVPQLSLPAERVWAQLGSSLANTPVLRSGWRGDSLIVGASGSNDGAGALYILNGGSLSSLSDLSTLESNSSLAQGLVILGSHKSGSISGLGQLVVDGGDTNRDGFNEILASAPNDLFGAGQVYMLYGGRTLELLPGVAGRPNGTIDLDGLDAVQHSSRKNLFLQTFEGVGGRDGYGTLLTGGHDLNGDGLADPLIGYTADSSDAGSIELWISRPQLQRRDDKPGVLESEQQAVPQFDRSLWVSARSADANQSDFHLNGASSVGDLNSDGYGEIVLSSDNRAALVFGDSLMPVYWEASSVLATLANTDDPGEASTSPRIWTTSWKESGGRRLVLSFCGRDADGDGRFSSANPNEIDWLALRVDSPAGDPVVALSSAIADRWLGALTISDASLNFDLDSRSFTSPVRLVAADAESRFSWASDGEGVNLDQGARELRARLITSNTPGVLNGAGIGDFNGDGQGDLALSQAGHRIPNSDGTGLVFQPGQTAVLFGDRNLAGSLAPLPLEQTSNGSSGLRLNSGGELSAIGDWNRDGKADLLIRDPAASGAAGAEQAGRQVLLLGRAAGGTGSLSLDRELQAQRAQLLQGTAANSLTGTSAAAGDFAGDGGRSLFLGAPNTISESDVRQAAAGMRVFTATQNGDGSWNTPLQLPDFGLAAPGQQQLSSYTAVGNRILATWVHSRTSASGATIDEIWAAFQDPNDGRWTPAHKLQQNQRGEAATPSIGEIQALALTDASNTGTGGVLLAWTTLDAETGRNFLFQSTYDPQVNTEGQRWSAPMQQDPDSLLLANQDAISGSQLKLQLNPGTAQQRSQVWAEAGINAEGDANAWITVNRSGDISKPLTLNYSTRDQSASAGSQYQDSRGRVRFTAGQASLTLAIPLLDNGNLECRNTNFAVDFSLPANQLDSAHPQLLLGDTPVSRDSGQPILSVSAGVQDNEAIRMRAIDAGISLLGPVTGSTGAAGTASTAVNPIPPSQTLQPKIPADPNDPSRRADPTPLNDSNLTKTIALVADPGAQEGLGQVYALFAAATASSGANPGMDWKQLNDIASLDMPTEVGQGVNKRQLNVLIQPEAALATLDPRAGFGSAMVKLRLNGGNNGLIGDTAFAISAPGNPLDGTMPSRVYVVNAKQIQEWAVKNPRSPFILNDSNSLIIEESSGGLFGSVLSAADLDGDGNDELIVGAPDASTVTVISGSKLLKNNTLLTGRKKPSDSVLAATVIHDSSSNATNGSSAFGSAVTALDLDGDQHLDLAIGAPKALPVRASSVFDEVGPIVANGGAVYVVRGTGDLDAFKGDVNDLVRSRDLKALRLEGHQKTNPRGNEDDPARPASEGLPPPGSFGFGEELGSALAAVDLNGDGLQDLAIGGPQYTPDGTLRTGRVVTWFGNGSPRPGKGWGESINLASLSATDGVSFVGQQGSGRVGASLAAAGDLNNDKNPDLAIGAPFEDGGAGRVYVAFGSQNRYDALALKTTGNSFALDSTSPDSPFQTFEAPAGYQLGQTVFGLGDVNNDSSTGIGGDDLFLGSPAAITQREVRDKGDLQYTDAGQTHLAWGRPWLGPNQSSDVPFTQGVGYLLAFGGVPLALGDLNGDGYGDYALQGSEADTTGSTDIERAQATWLRLRFGAPVEYEQDQLQLSSFALSPAQGTVPSDQVPQVVAGDFDGDGFGDVAALTGTGLKVLSGAPNLPLQGDSKGVLDDPGRTIGTTANVNAIVSGDFDGDGYDDLVQLSGSQTLQVFWGGSAGLQAGARTTITPSSIFRPSIDAIQAIDSNGDGVEELAVLGRNLYDWSSTAGNNWLHLLGLNRQSATPFSRALSSTFISADAAAVTTALSTGDLNGDGRQDLLVDRGGLEARVLLGQQNGRFEQNLTFSRQAPRTGLTRSQLARFIGDGNGDGRDDILFSPTSTQAFNPPSPYKFGPYSFIYLGSANPAETAITLPNFWDASDNTSPRNLGAWTPYGYSIESLPGEPYPYRTGSIGDVNGDGFDEVLFSSNQLVVGEKTEANRPHSVAIYGSNRLTPSALASTTSNDGSSADDTLHQLGSAGKQELLLRGKAGRDLLQVHGDPYGATLSIPDDGANAGRLTVSASNRTTLWSQPRNPYELVLLDGQLKIIKTDNDTAVKTWGGGEQGNIDRLYVDPKTGWLYGMDANQAYLNNFREDIFAHPNSSSRHAIDNRRGFSINTGFYEMQGWPQRLWPQDTPYGQLIFFPESGKLVLANRGAPDLKNSARVNTDSIILFEGEGDKVGKEHFTQVLYGGESLLSERGANKLVQAGETAIPMLSLNQLEASRGNLSTFLTEYDQSNPHSNSFGLMRQDNRHSGNGGLYEKSLERVLGRQYKDLIDGWAWLASKDASGQDLQLQANQGPLVAVMDGNGRLSINAQQDVEGQVRPGTELAVLHEGNADPFLPPIGSKPVLIQPDTPTDQVTQSLPRSTNNSFTSILKGGLDDDRLGIDSLERFHSADGQPAGLVDGGPGVDTLFFSSQRSDLQDPSIDLVGFGSRIRNIEAIEIPINNRLEIDEAPLLNTPLHRLKLLSRGAAEVTFHVRTAYQYIGDQLDAGLAYSVWSKPDGNLQLWVQQGRVSLNQQINNGGGSASLTSQSRGENESLSAGTPIDADGLAVDPAYAYRWYHDGQLIAGATKASYGTQALQRLEPGSYVRETDYTDRTGLRQTVMSAPIVVEPEQAVAGGTLRVRRSQLDARQRDQLTAGSDGLQPWPELLYLDFQADSSSAPIGVQLLTMEPPADARPGTGLVALVSPDGAALPQASLYDLDGDGRIDSLSWLPGEGTGGSHLEAAVLSTATPAALLTQNNDLGFLLPGDIPGGSRLPALQSLRISLKAAPEQVTSLIAIPLGADETLEGLTAKQRRQRALSLLSNQDDDPAPLDGRADRQRSLWLRTDQRLALLELQQSSPQDWDGSSGWQQLHVASTGNSGAVSLRFRASSGLMVRLSAETSAQDLNGLLARSQTQAPVLDFRGLDGLQLSGHLNVAREAEYNSQVGFYAIDTLKGEIRDPITQELVAPGDGRYGALALTRRIDALDGLHSDNRNSRSEALNFQASQLLAPYAIVQDPQLGATTYFGFARANHDGLSHFRSFGTNVIGLEDQAGGGDNDCDDLLMHLDLNPLT